MDAGHDPNVFVRRAVRGWWEAHKDSWDSIPKPSDDPVSLAEGPDPDRVLFIGDGPAMGFGVTSHDLALPGHLTRQVSRITGRGVELHLIADPQTTVSTALDQYLQRAEGPYRALLLLVGPVDSIRLTRAREFRSRLDALISRITHDGARRVLVVGIPPFSTMPIVPGLPGKLAQAHSQRLNRVLRELAEEHPLARFLPFEPPAERAEERYRTAATYGQWAALISPALAELLDELAAERAN